MRADDSLRQCQEARAYYYDFLCEGETPVPEVIRRHIEACAFCQGEVHRLRETLFEAEQNAGVADSSDVELVEALAQQFRLLDEHVTCRDAKPFLPELALSARQIRIPTPVTVHVDHCPPCRKDLAAIRDLHLTDDQLTRLGRLLERSRDQGAGADRQVRAAVAALQSLPPAGNALGCHDISMADLFNCVVPDVERNTPHEPSKAVAQHVRVCPACLAKAQTLQSILCLMIERADSETITVYHAGGGAEHTREQAGDAGRYPVDVQVLQGESQSDPGPCVPPAARTTGGHRFRRFSGLLAKVAVVAVVAIAIAALPMLPWINAPTASGTDVGEVLQSLAQVENIDIVTKDHTGKFMQEFWIARRSNRLVHRTAQQCTLFDIDQGRRTAIELATGTREVARLHRIECDRVRQRMADCLREVLAWVSPDTRLQHPTGDVPAAAGNHLDAYEVIWTPRGGGVPWRNRWMAYLDPTTGLPQQTESYVEEPHDTLGETAWGLTTRTVFTYPSEQEMNRRIQELFPAP